MSAMFHLITRLGEVGLTLLLAAVLTAGGAAFWAQSATAALR